MYTEGINEASLAERLESGKDFGILLRAFGPYSTLDADINALAKEKFFAVEDARIRGHELALSTIWIPWRDWQAIVHSLLDHASMVVFDLTNADRSGEQLTGLKDELVHAKSRKYFDKTLVVTGVAALSRQDLRELIEGFVLHKHEGGRHKLRTSLDLLAYHSARHRRELPAG